MTSEHMEALRLAHMDSLGFGPGAMRRIKVCASCGTGNDAARQVCSQCRSPLPQQTLYQQYKMRHLYCSGCDTVLPCGMRYCPQCGRPLAAAPGAPENE